MNGKKEDKKYVKHENYLWLYCMTLPQPCESLNELTTDLKQNVDQ